MNAFLPADILLPKTNEMEKWAVIACDQFTSDQAYWDRVRKNAEGAVSTINLILPEAELGTEMEAEHTAVITKTMADYMKSRRLHDVSKQLRLCRAHAGEWLHPRGPRRHGRPRRL